MSTPAPKLLTAFGDFKTKAEHQLVLDKRSQRFQTLTEDLIISIADFLGPIDFAHLLCSASHFKNCLDKDLIWTQFCLRALVHARPGTAKSVVASFVRMKRELEQTFPKEMIDVFSINLLATLPKRKLETDYSHPLSRKDFAERGMMFVERPGRFENGRYSHPISSEQFDERCLMGVTGPRKSYIALLIENQRSFLDRPPETVQDSFNIAFQGYGDGVTSIARGSMAYFTDFATLALHSVMLLGHASLTKIEFSEPKFIRELTKRYREYSYIMNILQEFIEHSPVADLIQDYEGRNGRIYQAELRELSPPSPPEFSPVLFEPFNRGRIPPELIKESSCRIVYKP